MSNKIAHCLTVCGAMKTVGVALAFAFLASTASAATVFVPCEDYGIPVPHSAFEETAGLSDSAGVLLTSSPAIGAGGYDDSGQPPAPLFTISVSPPLGFLPLPSRVPTPVPEMGAWLLMLIGFASLVIWNGQNYLRRGA